MKNATDPADAMRRAVAADRAMRVAQENHAGTWASALAVQNHRKERDAARSAIPRLQLVSD